MTVRFLFDVISPYAYLAWQRVHQIAGRHGHQVEPVPILFAALLNHHGHKGPAEIPEKRLYVMKDALRQAAQLGVPLAPPPSHPFNPLLALRVCALDLPVGTRRALVDALFTATWGGGPGVADPTVVQRICRTLGIDNALALASAPEIKARVRANTDAAVERGLWGVPTMMVDDEVFWGFDSLPHLDRYLAGEDTLDEASLARWAHLPASATRQ